MTYTREKLCFDDGWKRHIGDIPVPSPSQKGPAYSQAKSESALWGPAARHYLDNSDCYGSQTQELQTVLWENVTLPDDYTIRNIPDPSYNNARGYFPEENAWYRKQFSLEEADRGKRLLLHFEAISHVSDIYINGHLMAHSENGHLPIVIDFTDIADFDAPNVVAVSITMQCNEGWWYDGGGIYRHVWLEKTAPVAVAPFGVYVAPKKDAFGWTIPVELSVVNSSLEMSDLVITLEILDAAGNVVADALTGMDLPAKETDGTHAILHMSEPLLWSPEEPNLYRLRTVLYEGVVENELDRVETVFGFRTVELDPKQGLLLNGKPTYLYGVCCHEDYGLCGKAVPDAIKRYRLQLLKEMGANGYRGAHYPHSEQTLDACDELGLLVMDETRRFNPSETDLADLRKMILRDRNHPSVIFWSIGNEEPLTATEQGKKIAQTMAATVRRYDKTRFVTMAVDRVPHEATVYDALDVIAINYGVKSGTILKTHEKYPDKVILAGESCATSTTRAWYDEDDPALGYIKGYDQMTNAWFTGREETIRYYDALRPWHAGFFQWAGIEHRGETVWPRLCSQSGALDLFLQKKDAFYQNQSHFTAAPMIHLLPHWNLREREGELLPVWAYTNCEEAELFVDGKSCGRQKLAPFAHGAWEVCYHPGRLEVVGYRSGEIVARDVVETTGEPVALRLDAQIPRQKTTGKQFTVLHCVCLDSAGRVVPDAAPTVSFRCSAGGRIVATGSDVCDHTPPASLTRRMRAGVIAVLLEVSGEVPVRVYASAPALTPAKLIF